MAKLIDVKSEEFRELWLLLLEEPEDLTDEQIDRLIESSEALRDYLYLQFFHRLPGHYEIIRLARRKRRNFSRLPTKRLEEKYQEALGQMEVRTRRGSILEGIGRLSLDSLPANSDICVLREILEKRRICQ